MPFWKKKEKELPYLGLRNIKAVKIADLKRHVYTPRREVSMEWVENLADSLENEGLREVIVITDKMEVVDGEHRLEAATRLGWTTIPAEIRRIDEAEAYVQAVRLNDKHGLRLSPIEESGHIKILMEKFDKTQSEIAQMFGKTQQWVSLRLKLINDAAPELAEAVTNQFVTPTAATEIAKLPTQIQGPVVEKVRAEDLSKNEVATLVKILRATESPVDDVLRRPFKTHALSDSEPLTTPHRAGKRASEAIGNGGNTIRCECGREYAVDWEGHSWYPVIGHDTSSAARRTRKRVQEVVAGAS